VERREIDILLGTQMIAKGLDFPFVTLVGVVNADVAMNLPDFRASERTFQLLTQVAGRAGRHERGGEVIVQTALPNHYAIRCAVEHDYLAFAAKELHEREGPRYPPHVRLVNVLISGIKEGAVQEEADRSAQWMRSLIDGMAAGKVEVTGPAPCPIDRIRGRWRWHYLLRGGSAKALGLVCRHLQYRYEFKPGPAELRLIIDRDPVSLL
jgi:primosomal protein N' (replication factor Y) (superfamily II helicase)